MGRESDAARPDGHHRELRAGRGGEGRQGAEEAAPDIPALPPTRRGAQTADGRPGERRGQEVSDPAFGRERQEQLHRLAGPPAHRAAEGRAFARLRRGRRGDAVRLRNHRDRPPGVGQADQGHDQAIRPGIGNGGPCGAKRRPAAVPARGQEDHHHHGAEVPLHPGRDRGRASRAQVRHRD